MDTQQNSDEVSARHALFMRKACADEQMQGIMARLCAERMARLACTINMSHTSLMARERIEYHNQHNCYSLGLTILDKSRELSCAPNGAITSLNFGFYQGASMLLLIDDSRKTAQKVKSVQDRCVVPPPPYIVDDVQAGCDEITRRLDGHAALADHPFQKHITTAFAYHI